MRTADPAPALRAHSPARRVALAAAAVAALWLAVALAALPLYGPTWDATAGELAFGERVVDYLYGNGESFRDGRPLGIERREPHPEFPSFFAWYQCYPFANTLAALSCDVLWTRLGLVSPVVAHHLPAVLLTAALVFVLVLVVGRRAGVGTGVLAALFLLASPRFATHAFNNLKDAPEAVLYTLAVLGFACACERGRRWLWLAAGVAAGCAFAQKANALFLPVQLGLTGAAWLALGRRSGAERPRVPLLGLALLAASTVATYFAVSPQLWGDPWPRLVLHWSEPFRVGNTLTGGLDAAETSLDGPLQVLVSSPLPTLALALVGLVAAPARWRILLAVWLVVTVGRTTLPGMRNFDGVRHFLEFWPAVAIAAALGTRALAGALARAWPRSARRAGAVAGLAALAAPLAATVSSAPYGTSWFNALAGGLSGARESGIAGAGDYWASSTWDGLAWIDANASAAEPCEIWVPLAPFVARAGAPQQLSVEHRLRARPPEPNEALADEVFVLYVLRPGWFGPFLRWLDLRRDTLVHEIEVQGAPILRVHRLSGDALAQALAIWRRQAQAIDARSRLIAWATADAQERIPLVLGLTAASHELPSEELARQVGNVLPPEQAADALDALWLYHPVATGAPAAQPEQP